MLLDVPFKPLSSVAPLCSILDPSNIIQENKRGAGNAVERLLPLELNITRTVSIMKHNYSGAAKPGTGSSSYAGFFSWSFPGGKFQRAWEFDFFLCFSSFFSPFQSLLWLRLFLSQEIYKNFSRNHVPSWSYASLLLYTAAVFIFLWPRSFGVTSATQLFLGWIGRNKNCKTSAFSMSRLVN